MMKIEDIMSTDPLSVRGDATIREAVQALLGRGVGSALVVEDDRLTGIVTEADLLAAVHEADGFDGSPVASVMSSPIVTTTRRTSVTKALRTMDDSGIRHLPVIEGSHLVGIVTFSDVAANLPDSVDEVRRSLGHPPNTEEE